MKYKALSKMTNDELVIDINSKLKASETYFYKQRQNIQKAFEVVDGYQWEDEDIQSLTEEQRTYVVFNRIAVSIDAIVGLGISNPQNILPIPIDVGDVHVDEIIEGAIRYIRKDGNIEEEEGHILNDLFVGGVGVGNIYVDYSSLNPKIKFERVNPVEMTWDPNAEKMNLLDKKWCARERLYLLDDIDYLWPGTIDKLGLQDVDDDYNNATIASSPWLNTTYKPSSDYGQERGIHHQYNIKKTGVPVKEFQWSEYKDVWQLSNLNNGQVFTVSVERYNKIKDQFNLDSYPKAKTKKRIFYKAFMIKDKIVERFENASERFFTYFFVTGKRDNKTGCWYGIVRGMEDPQRWANKFFSLILDIVAKNAKGGAFVEKDALDNPRKAEEDWSKPNALIQLKRGGIQRVKERAIGQYPVGIDNLMRFSIESIRDVSGINIELLGLADRRQAGVLEQTRKQSALTILARFFLSMTLMRKMQGQVIIEFIRKFYTPTQLIKIDSTNAQRFEMVQFIFDNDILEYDILVDEAPTSTNVKERVWFALIQLLPILLKMGVPIPPEIFDYAPIPARLADKWKAALGGQPLVGQQGSGQQGGDQGATGFTTSPQNVQEQSDFLQ